jgi:hypothetical protein
MAQASKFNVKNFEKCVLGQTSDTPSGQNQVQWSDLMTPAPKQTTPIFRLFETSREGGFAAGRWSVRR